MEVELAYGYGEDIPRITGPDTCEAAMTVLSVAHRAGQTSWSRFNHRCSAHVPPATDAAASTAGQTWRSQAQLPSVG